MVEYTAGRLAGFFLVEGKVEIVGWLGGWLVEVVGWLGV